MVFAHCFGCDQNMWHLIERRSESLTDGMDRLCVVAARMP